MKDLLIAAAAMVILIGTWLVFFSVSENTITDFTQTVEKTIIPAVEDENWDKANDEMKRLNKKWHKYKKTAILFLDTEAINEIDYSMAKSVKYVKAEDVSNSSGELNSMTEQLTFLNSNDKVNLGNIL